MMLYETEYVLKEECIDSFGSIHPDEVLKMFETVAADHASRLGVGFSQMSQRGILWMVTQVRYDVLSAAAPGTVRLRTWPFKPTRLGLERDYIIYDQEGREIVKGSSVWFLIDAVSRKMCSCEDVYPSEEYWPHKNYEKRARRLRDFEADVPALSTVPDDSYIDGNGHVNNTKYAKLARLASGDGPALIKSYQIDFLHEVLKGERIDLFVSHQDGEVTVRGQCEEKGRVFLCKTSF